MAVSIYEQSLTPCKKCIVMKDNMLVGKFNTPLKMHVNSQFLLSNLEVSIPIEWKLQRESPIEANYINCMTIIS